MDISDSQFFTSLESGDLVESAAQSGHVQTKSNSRIGTKTGTSENLNVKPVSKRLFLGGIYEDLPVYATPQHQKISKEISIQEKSIYNLREKFDSISYRTQILESEMDLINNEVQYYSKLKKAKNRQLIEKNKRAIELENSFQVYEKGIGETTSRLKNIETQIELHTNIGRELEPKLQILQEKGLNAQNEFERFTFQAQLIEQELESVQESLSSENDDLNKIPTELGDINSEISRLHASIYDNESEVISLVSVLSQISTENDSLQITENEIFTRWQNVNDRIRNHRNTLAQHKIEVQRLETEKKSNSVAMNQVKTQLEEAKATFKRTERGLIASKSRHSELLNAKSETDEETKRTRGNYESLIVSMEKTKINKASIESRVKKLYKEIQSENKQYLVEKVALADVKKSISILLDNSQNQEAKLAQSQHILDAKMKEIRLLYNSLDSYQAELARKNTMIEESENLEFDLQSSIQSMKIQCNSIKKGIEKNQSEIDRLNFHSYGQRLKIAKFTRNIAIKINGDSDTFQNQQIVEEQKQQLKYLNEQSNNIRSENSLVSSALSALDGSISDLQQEVTDISQEQESIISKLYVLKSAIRLTSKEQKSTTKAILEKSLAESMLIFHLQKEQVKLQMIFSKSSEITQKAQAYIELLKRQSISRDEKMIELQSGNRQLSEKLQTFSKVNHAQKVRLEGLNARKKNIILSQYDHKYVLPDETWEEFDERINNEEEEVINSVKASLNSLKQLKRKFKILKSSEKKIANQNEKIGNNLMVLADRIQTQGKENLLKAAGYVMDETTGSLSITALVETLERVEKDAMKSGDVESNEFGPISMLSRKKLLKQKVAKATKLLKKKGKLLDRHMIALKSRNHVIENLNIYLEELEKNLREENEGFAQQNMEFQYSNEKICRAAKRLAGEIEKISQVKDRAGKEVTELILAAWIQIVIFSICRLAVWGDAWNTLKSMTKMDLQHDHQEVNVLQPNGNPSTVKRGYHGIDQNIRSLVKGICKNLGIEASPIWAQVEDEFSVIYQLFNDGYTASQECSVVKTHDLVNQSQSQMWSNINTGTRFNETSKNPRQTETQTKSGSKSRSGQSSDSTFPATKTTRSRQRVSKSKTADSSKGKPKPLVNIPIVSWDGDAQEELSQLGKGQTHQDLGITNIHLSPETPIMSTHKRTRKGALQSKRGTNLFDPTMGGISSRTKKFNIEEISMSSTDPLERYDEKSIQIPMRKKPEIDRSQSNIEDISGSYRRTQSEISNQIGLRTESIQYSYGDSLIDENYMDSNSNSNSDDQCGSISTPSTFESEGYSKQPLALERNTSINLNKVNEMDSNIYHIQGTVIRNPNMGQPTNSVIDKNKKNIQYQSRETAGTGNFSSKNKGEPTTNSRPRTRSSRKSRN